MIRYAVMMTLALLILAAAAPAQAVDAAVVTEKSSQKVRVQEKRKDAACGCCQKCKAAKSAMEKSEEEGSASSNGCRDCCARCGEKLKPLPQETPPELMDKKAPPVKMDDGNPTQAGTISHEPESADKTKHDACECCQKCKAAKGVIKSEEDDSDAEGNGCEDCCARCGQPLKATPEETPAEILEKEPPPDIIEKQDK